MEPFLSCDESAVLFSGNPIKLLPYVIVLTMDDHVTCKFIRERLARLNLVPVPSPSLSEISGLGTRLGNTRSLHSSCMTAGYVQNQGIAP